MSPKIRVPHIRVEAPSDILSEQQKQQQEVAFLRPLQRSDQNENDPNSSSSSFGQGNRSSRRTALTSPNDFHESNQIRDFKGEYRTARIQAKAKSRYRYFTSLAEYHLTNNSYESIEIDSSQPLPRSCAILMSSRSLANPRKIRSAVINHPHK